MKFHTIILGAGPSGLAAALAASKSGANVAVIDDNFSSGGQIWRGGAHQQKDSRAQAMWTELNNRSHVHFYFQSKVIHAQSCADGYELLIENTARSEPALRLQANSIILCTGARELLLPFPGWTLPGVTGAGGLQALCKNGYPVQGKRIVVAGTGPLLLAVAATLRERGAIVTHIVEQSPLNQLASFGLKLWATPEKIKQSLQLAWALKDSRYWSNSYVAAAQGKDTLTQIQVQHGDKIDTIPCDLLACGYGLIPNTELAAHLQCQLTDTDAYQAVIVDEWQRTSQANIYCAGEGCGIGGVDKALAEGRIAGYAASGQTDQAQASFKERKKWRTFARHLHQHFQLRPELRTLAQDDTLICRCEDVSLAQLKQHADWRSAKLHTRCGMGACQGRICGAANRFLFSWEKDAGRSPVSGALIASLISTTEAKREE